MKKHFLTALSALMFGTVVSQTQFLEKTCYRGAFAPAPTPMWTEGWTEWDPQNKVYPAPTVTVSADITASTTWSTGQVIFLSKDYGVFVKNNAVLTIQPGVIVRADAAKQGSSLIVCKGSRLEAVGTAANPIVFTSSQPEGQRSKGDWGGIILLGKAGNNTPGGINNIEGVPVSADTEYGVASGADDNDNSGTLKYVRAEFGGFIYQQDKEINGFTFGAVGRGTTLDYLQASFVNDDAFEWFGGTVNAKHLVSYRNLDDDFDTDFGYRGTVQFGLAVRDPQIADAPAVSTSEFFESDNNAAGTSLTPITSAVFSNMTCIGPLRGVSTATVADGHRNRARIRRNSALRIVNSILTDQATNGVFIDGSASQRKAVIKDSLVFANNILAGFAGSAVEAGTIIPINLPASGSETTTLNNWFAASNNTVVTGNASNILITPYNYTSPDYRPSTGSPALSGQSFSNTYVSEVTNTSGSSSIIVSVPSSTCISDGTVVNTFTFVPTVDLGATPNFCSYSWNVSSGVSVSNSTAINPSFSISTVGSFSITLTGIDGYGNISSQTQAIITSTCGDVGVAESKFTLGRVSLYPNPASDMATVSVATEKVASLSIAVCDVTGKVVAVPVVNGSLVSGENTFTINTTELQNGIYFVTLNSSNGMANVKLIVNK